MATVVVVGLQWGDEGKGKIVDLYAEFASTVVRFGGGANAGHTLVVDGHKVVTHLVPSGILRGKGKRYLLADGMVIDPTVLLHEIATFRALGLIEDHRDLMVGQRAHVILPHHRELDRLREQGQSALGTTRRGIGPAYEAKMARRGVHMADLLHIERLREKIHAQYAEAVPVMQHLGGQPPSLEAVVDEYAAYGRQLAPYIQDVTRLLAADIRRGQHVLLEAAQGALLDVDHGTYPFVTSSNTVAASACIACGIGPTQISKVIGITKAYATRVGHGPFPTEMLGEEGGLLREAGGEYGATTGRPRRCGWLDVAALRPALRWNGAHGFVLTKLDVLSGYPRIRLGVGYTVTTPQGPVQLDELPLDAAYAADLQPIYEEIEGWSQNIQHVREWEELPLAAKRYVERLERLLEIPCVLISVGPNRSETIVRTNPFR